MNIFVPMWVAVPVEVVASAIALWSIFVVLYDRVFYKSLEKAALCFHAHGDLIWLLRLRVNRKGAFPTHYPDVAWWLYERIASSGNPDVDEPIRIALKAVQADLNEKMPYGQVWKQ